MAANLKESPTTDCVEWQGYVNENGYGRVWWEGRKHYAHRVAAGIALGREIEASEVVLHVCDNRLCCNPNHLIVGTLQLNAQDMHAKGRGRGTYASKKLSPDDVVQIRQCLKLGHGVRQLSDRYCVGDQTIRDVRDGNTWRGLHGVLPQKPLFDPWAEAA